MDILILGGAGELGANFANLCLSRGHSIRIIDIIRFYEAARLRHLSIQEKVNYVWKSSFDLTEKDIIGADLILDCACQADRPLGTSSPRYTLMENLQGPLNLLETIHQLGSYQKWPFVLYPSSSVEFLGVPKEEQPITESTIPRPTNVYGYTKWAAEELYRTYNRSFKVPCMIIRTGSCYGPMMRTDQFIAQCIIKCLKNEHIRVKSPEASRTYTFTEDVMEFYRLFLEKFEQDDQQFDGFVIYNGGNQEDKPYTTMNVAEIIQNLTGAQNNLSPDEYEVGELVNNQPVYQWEKSLLAEKLLGWKPKYALKDGLKKTIAWFDHVLEEWHVIR